MEKVSAEERDAALNSLEAWSLVNGRDAIHRSFAFKDFNVAFSFMTHIALFAEKINYHPEWSNVYNRVEIILSTHDAGGLSQKDFEMAAFIDTLAV